MNRQTENEKCWEELSKDCYDADSPNGSGFPKFFGIPWTQLFRDKDRIYIYPIGGTCLYLNKDGTWEGDANITVP